MRILMEIIGIILLINGIGGLWNDDFGLLGRFADGAALTALQGAAVLAGAALTGESLWGRRSAKARRKSPESSDDWTDDILDELL
ncbi:hypothetical protein [Nesterenkonia sp. PF2B19]|uniref:hypothetical protein n=1 Tax=Nesterenkonia sp. PF2B19 TaxID=1881858 RepID=UPI000872D3E7|nr:hypothetical protein [Nesterenkonia sp. PF2B19]OSM43680.1 hypothetical protein BCY76_007095 [Nesterenkonia sp. PF2B19]